MSIQVKNALKTVTDTVSFGGGGGGGGGGSRTNYGVSSHSYQSTMNSVGYINTPDHIGQTDTHINNAGPGSVSTFFSAASIAAAPVSGGLSTSLAIGGLALDIAGQ